MPCIRNFTEAEKTHIFYLSNQGLSQRKIADTLNISQSAVSGVLKRIRESGTFNLAAKSGRPSKLSQRDESFIVREVVNSPFKTCREIQSDFMHIKEISAKTIARVLDRNDLKVYKTFQVPFLNNKMKEKRMIFADKYFHSDLDFWKGILWSDESRICLKITDRPTLDRRPKNKVSDERYLKSSVRHLILVMAWGCFISYYSPGSLVFIDATLNSQRYEESLKNKMIHNEYPVPANYLSRDINFILMACYSSGSFIIY